MIIYTMKRNNGDWAYVRSIGNKYCADVTTHTGRNANDIWHEVYDTPKECRKELEKYGFKLA